MANSYREYLKMKKYGGEGGDAPSPTLISKTINANGLYLPEDDQADGYNSVSVNVPEVSDIAFVPPQKFKSNGSNLEDYKIFGSDGVAIETETGVLPLTFTTTEDKLRDWEIRGNDEVGENLFDKNNYVDNTPPTRCTAVVTATGFKISATNNDPYIGYYVAVGQSGLNMGGMVEVEPNTTYYLCAVLPKCYISFLDANKNGCTSPMIIPSSNTYTYCQFITPSDCKYVLLRFGDGDMTSGQELEFSNVMLVKGSTAPDHYIPYQQGVGERTVNLFDKTQYAMVPVDNQGATRCGTAIPITDGTYTLSFSKDTTRALFIHTILNGSITSGVNVTSLSPYTFTLSDVDTLIIRSSYPTLTPWDESGYTNIMLVEGSTAPSTYVPYGYQIPLTVSQQGQPDKTVDIYIGDSPLTEGETVSKISTGIDIATTEGENTISTTLYNKPETSVTYTESGVGEEVSGSYVIPVKINSTTTNVPIGDTPLMEDEYVSYAEQKIYRYVDGALTPVDPPSALPQIATANGVNELSVETDIQPELVQIGLGIPVELIPTALGTKNITANDTYDASDDSLDGYSSVTVNIRPYSEVLDQGLQAVVEEEE